MLILKAPIGLKNRNDYISADDSFYQRISANYSLMGSDIGQADLLHAVTSPPEIFIGEGDITTVSGNTFINNRNEEKLKIFNNLLNRIVVNADMPLTYQDRTYISDVLYKIGIKNDALFMREVRRIREENENTQNFITEFLIGGEEARDSAIRQYISNFLRNMERNETPSGERVRESYLSREIMDRLHTGAIYQILANFNTSLSNDFISRNEFMISEQAATARELLTERLISRVIGERGELVYRNENIYEEEFLSENHEEGTVNNEITAAVLLDMVRNLYSAGYEKVVSDNRKWMEFRDVFYNSSDNTLRRLEYITSDDFYTSYTRAVREETVMEFPSLEPSPGEEEEGRVNEESALIRQLVEINERNVRNMEKYNRLLSVVERARGSGRRSGGEGMTMNAARRVLKEDINPEELLERREESEAEKEERVLREIERLFPEGHSHITQILKQYSNNRDLTQNMSLTDNNISSLINDIESVRVENLERELVHLEGEGIETEETRELREIIDRQRALEEAVRQRRSGEAEEAERILRQYPDTYEEVVSNVREIEENRENIRERQREVTREIKRLEERGRGTGSGSTQEEDNYPEAEIVHKSNESLTREEIEETLEEFKRSTDRKTETRDTVEEYEQRRQNVVRTTEENTNNMTEKQIEDISFLVDRGVRARMDSISNEVMQRLEKRLRNEKARRGI